MAKKDPKTLLKQGWVHVLVTFEIIGKPAKHVDDSLKLFITEIKKHDDKVFWLEDNIGKAERTEEKSEFYGAFAEVDMLIKDLETITWIATDYTPASIEIIEPTQFELSALVIQNWTNDLLSKLHTIGAATKTQNSQLEYLKTNLLTLIQNTILMSLGRGPKNLDALAKDTTLTNDALKQHLDKLKEDKKVTEKKGVYSLA